ncbi:MAG: hypothetical protein ACOYOP_06855 [Microthrixaceae bacterium]
MNRLPSFMRDRSLLLLLAPLIAVLAVLGATRLDASTPAERRAARASTTTTTTTTTTAPPNGAPAEGGGAPGVEVAGAGTESGGAADRVSDSTSAELTGALLEEPSASVESAVVETPGSPAVQETPTTTPTTAAPTTVAPNTGVPTTEPPATTAPTTAPTTTLPPVSVRTATVPVELDCQVLAKPGDAVTATFTSAAIVGVSTYDRFPAGASLPFAVRIGGPTNSTGPATPGQLSQLVFLSATGQAAPRSFSTLNSAPYGALANFLIPDDPQNQALVGQLDPVQDPGGAVAIVLGEIRTDRSGVSQRCLPRGGPVTLITSSVADPNTTTTTVALPTPVVPEAPLAALLPLSALLIGALGLALVVRRRRLVGGSRP